MQSTSSQTTFTVAERELLDDDETYTPRIFITNVPIEVDRQQIKEMLEKADRTFGTVGDKKWVNHTVLPAEKWVNSLKIDFAQSSADEITITYKELLEEAKGEKGMSLTLPKKLYTNLSKRADELDMSLNDLCCELLQAAVDTPSTLSTTFSYSGRKLSQRHAMRALYQIHGGKEAACVRDMIKLFRKNLVVVKSNPERYPPEVYAPNLWRDGVHKGWLTDSVSDEVVSTVRKHID